MLKVIDPRLNAEVLYALALMGHGDEVVVADANFPAASTAAQTAYGRLLHLDNLTLGQSVEAILTLLPLDRLVSDGACRMQIDEDPSAIPPVQREAQTAIDAAEVRPLTMTGVARADFYERAKRAYAVILTGERRFYGTMLLRKGVIDPPG
jgi:L-fucose mutarotase